MVILLLASITPLAEAGTATHFPLSESSGRKWPANVGYTSADHPITSGSPVVLYKPTDPEYDISQPGNKPDNRQLALDWVYGYRGKDYRSNLHYLPNGQIAYFIAAVVVLYDSNYKKQRYYSGHNDDFKCMAIHPTKTKIASGQVAGVDLEGKLRHP